MKEPTTKDMFTVNGACPTTITHVSITDGPTSHPPMVAKGAPPPVKSLHPAPYMKSV